VRFTEVSKSFEGIYLKIVPTVR